MENKNYRILNLEGAWFTKNDDVMEFNTTAKVKYKTKGGKYIEYIPNQDKLYSATMPYSLETYRAFTLYPNEVWKENGELYTSLFVNFKFKKDRFDYDGKDNVIKVNKKKLRIHVYTSIVKIDNIEYCFFKRGASKARTANVIFCKKDCYYKLIKPSLLGLKFEKGKEYNITSKEAYMSLIMSGIIGIINIKPENILIINDIESSSFSAKQTVTRRDEDGNIYQDENVFDVVNNITDGQALMDESIYQDNELLKEATCALLRNDFLKANACRTRLQEYYNQHNITKVWDMYMGWIDATKIKLIITPSSCKYLKFANQFNNEKECFLDWLNRIPKEFGVVKIDHIGNYGYSNRLSYQMVNSMNLNPEEVKILIQDELKYYKYLKDNTLATSADIRKMSREKKDINRNTRNQMAYFLDLLRTKNSEEMSSSDMVLSLLDKNIDFRFTKKFKDWKHDQLKQYLENIRFGKIRIKNSLYAIMISCPYEMLLATTYENNKINGCIMDGWECYCPRFKDGQELMAIRNPQINAGNIGCLINKYHDEYKWFGYNIDGRPVYDFVIFVNTYNVDLMNRLQGCDFDVDTVFINNDDLLVRKAKESQKWATPVNGIKGKSTDKIYNNKSLAKLDNYLGGSSMSIGKIVNKSAILNGYMYNAINKGYSKKYIEACYEASSTLSSFSQIAIDMAKKDFNGLSLTRKMNDLNYTYYINDDEKREQILKFEFDYKNLKIIDEDKYNEKAQEIIGTIKNGNNIKYKVAEKKMIVPYFFTYIAKDNDYRIPKYMDCGMDYLEKTLDEVSTKAIKTDKVNIKDLIVVQRNLSGSEYNTGNIDKSRIIIDNCQFILDKNKYDVKDRDKEKQEKSNYRYWAKKRAIKELKTLKLNEKTVYRIVIRSLGLDKKYKGKSIEKIDSGGNKLTYIDKDSNKEVVCTVREFKAMIKLTLTLLYYAYPENFIKCFKEKQEKINTKRFWI